MVGRDQLVFIMRWMLERVTHKINVACTVKRVITEKRVKIENVFELVETPLRAPLDAS